MNISCILPTGLRLASTLSAQSAAVGRFTLAHPLLVGATF